MQELLKCMSDYVGARVQIKEKMQGNLESMSILFSEILMIFVLFL